MTPIVKYLEKEQLPSDSVEARHTKARVARYTTIDGTLYRRGASQPLLRCLDCQEVDYALRELHEGITGAHQGARVLTRLALRQGYYWPTMAEDSRSLVRSCSSCQLFE